MHIDSVAALVRALSEHQLLEPTQLVALSADLHGRFQDPQALAFELVQRSWLSAYQVERLFEGKAPELVVGGYCILDHLGRGGMGEVFKARHRRLDRIVALKLVRKEHLDHPDAIRRFQREARAAARLKHANIVSVYDSDQVGDTYFMAMELVDGLDLAKLVREHGPLPATDACDYARQAALGLQHAHEQGLVHRDIKPSNLILDRASERPLVKILDFGLARLVREIADETSLTPTGHWMGTPDYIAPEQARSSKEADIRADIFSLGCSLFFFLTGKQAFPGETHTEKLAARFSGDALLVRSLRPQLPPDLERVLRRMLARSPLDRYQTPAEAAEALTPFSRGDGFTNVSGGDPFDRSTRSGDPLAEHETHVATAPPSVPEPSATVPHPTAPPPDSFLYPPPAPPRRWPAALVFAGLAALLLVFVLPKLFDPGPGPSGTAPGGAPGDPPRFITNSIQQKFVRVPAGKFVMGAPVEEVGSQADERPQHEVELTRAFYFGVYEVTQEEYVRVMDGLNPSRFCKDGEGKQLIGNLDTRRHPVESVSWSMAKQFCIRLSERDEERKAGRRYRLPTEAEWEYACRAGSRGPFHFGDTLGSKQALFDYTMPYQGGPPKFGKVTQTVPVGSFPSNAFDLHDMHGSVAEWCEDRFGPYSAKAERDPLAPNRTNTRVLRGGSWGMTGSACRSAARQSMEDRPEPFNGLRIVCEITSEAKQ